MYRSRLYTNLTNVNVLTIFFHSSKKPSGIKAYKTPKVNYLPFPSSSGGLFFTSCLESDFNSFLDQFPKDCYILSVWSAKNKMWLKSSDYSFIYNNSSFFFFKFINLVSFYYKN